MRDPTDAPDPAIETPALPDSVGVAVSALLAHRGLGLAHPPDVIAEAERWVAAPGIDDPTLPDLRPLAFVTIDGPNTRDLDQALFVQASSDGFIAYYAIADAAYYVRPGSALFREALARGASYYLPGLSVPMLPRILSEGVISLNPNVDRRAMVFEMEVDRTGACTHTQVYRARIRSRAQLTFEEVQAQLDGDDPPNGSKFGDDDIARSLHAFARVGELRIHDALQRDVVSHRNAEVQIGAESGEGLSFVAIERVRNRVEQYGEQLSLLCNTEGARILHEGASKRIQPVFRTHQRPAPERLQELAHRIERLAELWNLGPAWKWNWPKQSLADFVRNLPHEDPQVGSIAKAISRQAIMVNARSMFSCEPGPHFGIGADIYARFSAPMREIVGVFVHKEMWELLGQSVHEPEHDEVLRDAVIAAANRSRSVQRELTHEVNLLALSALFEPELIVEESLRPVHTGVVMGLQRGKVYVRLDDPPLDVKLYPFDVGSEFSIDPDEVYLRRGERVICRLGERVTVRLAYHDTKRSRYMLRLIESISLP